MRNFISLTRVADNAAVAIRRDSVRLIEEGFADEGRPAFSTLTLVDGSVLAVVGTVEEIIAQLEN